MRTSRLLAIAFCLCVAGAAGQDRILQTVPPKAKVYRKADVTVLRVNELVSATPVMARTLTLSQTMFKQGGKSPKHNHPEEEIVYLVSGRLKVWTEGGEYELEAGDRVLFESYVAHQIEALEDCVIVEAFGPGRLLKGHE